MRKTYIVTCTRVVTQQVRVTAHAESKDEAIMLVEDGHVPAQWPDGTYLDPRHHASITAEEQK